MRVLKSVGLFYLCYDRQDAHHSNKNGQGGWGEMNDLEIDAEIIIIVTEVSYNALRKQHNFHTPGY